jgi:RimJ/RimL family protein N-acetyltransferase
MPADAQALRDLRLEALCAHPIAFTADLAAEQARTLADWQDLATRGGGRGVEVIHLALSGSTLAGMCGVYTPKQPKLCHSGIVWGVYIRPAFRGRGLASALLRATVDWARSKGLLMLRLSATQENTAAIRCYQRVGFVTYGVEPATVRWEGRLYDETLMALRL